MSIAHDIEAALHRARRSGVASSIYLSRQHSDQLRSVTYQRFDRFDGVPIYLDRDVSMVIFADDQSRTGLVIL